VTTIVRRSVAACAVSLAVVGLLADCKGHKRASTKSHHSTSHQSTSDGGRSEDVTIIRCEPDGPSGHGRVGYSVTNHSDKRSDFTIKITVSDAAGKQIGTVQGGAKSLPRGQSSAPQEGFTSSPASGKLTCKVTDITRSTS
jgi:hypothetical protein